MKIIRFHALAWEDYLMVVSMILAVVYGASTTLLYTVDLTQHSAFRAPKFAEYLYISHAIGFMAPLFGRISFCLYMLRVFSTTSAARKRCIIAFIATQALVNVPISIFVFTQCGHFHTLWAHGLSAPAASCVSHDVVKTLALVAVVFNALTDVFLTILPAVVVWSIKVMTSRARLGLGATLGLSFFASVASAIKIYYVYALYTFSPSVQTVGRLIIVMGVEINVVIISASIPVLAPLFLQKSGKSRKNMYKEPELATYDISREGQSFSLQSSNKFSGSPVKGESVSVVAKEVRNPVGNESSEMASQTNWDEMPELVFLSGDK
ncbi:hypothetical protein E4T45_09652 [Aureobasidium sp. EXF-8846]|nr:hypothetical protein E4T45_09652 [Aureobasidium sp. EXF-8846]